MSHLILFAKALADPTRWRILQLVLNEALCVCELADILEMPQSSVSSHVQVIRKSGILESERCEKWTYFRVAPSFQQLLITIEQTFPFEHPPLLIADQARAAKRLSYRETSCCPRPVHLKTKR